MYTLTVGVASSQMNFAQTNGLGFLMAQAVFASVPILIVYVIFQRYIVPVYRVRRRDDAMVAIGVPAVLAAALVRGDGLQPPASRGPVQITLQRFFGACDAEYRRLNRRSAAEGECGIITTLINKFNADNPDIHVKVNIVYWPGYDQLSAELAAGHPPDLVTMHESVISDYSQRHLIMPLDAVLASVGVDPAGFTRAAREGVTRDGSVYALPFDNWAPLWHINMNLLRAAGLVRDGAPVLPHSPEELLQQARQFTRATGKPYLIQSMVNEPSRPRRAICSPA
jgi:multiple sugar transport system substrate-binding protein